MICRPDEFQEDDQSGANGEGRSKLTH